MPTVVMVNAPDSLLEERRRRGLDRRDEMWDGVIHLVPPAGTAHGRRQARLAAVLIAAYPFPRFDGGTEVGVFRPGHDDDYRVPDLAFAEAAHVTDRGIEGRAALVVEIRSPGDESWAKLGFYGDVGVGEVLVVDGEAHRVHLLVNRDGTMVEQQPDADGWVALFGPSVRLRFDEADLWVDADGEIGRI